MTLRAILFDAGNTLLFLDYARMASAVGAALGLPLTVTRLEQSARSAAAAMDTGQGRDRERAAVFLETLFRTAGVPAARLDDLRRLLARLHDERHLWASTACGTREALLALRAVGLRLGVVSNSDGRVEVALEAADIRDCFDVVVDSALVGLEKPDPAIFHVALDGLGVSADEALYVGDLYEVDIVGARAAGLEAVLIDPAEGGRECRRAVSVPALARDLLGGAF